MRLSLSLLFLALLILAGCEDGWTPSEQTADQASGDQLVSAIERYAEDHGDVPASLNELVPKYVPAIEPPTVRNGQWEYRKKPYKGGFEISFSDGHWVLQERSTQGLGGRRPVN